MDSQKPSSNYLRMVIHTKGDIMNFNAEREKRLTKHIERLDDAKKIFEDNHPIRIHHQSQIDQIHQEYKQLFAENKQFNLIK